MASPHGTTRIVYSASVNAPFRDVEMRSYRQLPNGIAVANFLEGNSYINVTANGTTTIKTGIGTFCALMINTKGGSGNTVTIYDNTAASGTKICTIDTTSSLTFLPYNAAFATGLTIVMATGTPADITIMYI
jgi:hypothetical protein